MKRIISFVMALSILLGLMSVGVYAAEGEAFTVDFGNYDKSTAFTADNARYYMKSTTKGENWTIDVANTTSEVYYAGTTSAPRLQANVTITRRDRTDGVAGNASLAIKFTAPKSGVYDVSVDVYEYSSAGYGDVHLIDGTNRIYLGSFASHKASAPFADVNKKLLSVTLEGNKEYSLAFTPTEKIGNSGNTIYIYRTNFTPTDNPASVVLTATADKTALVVGDTAKATASASLSNEGMYKLDTAGGKVTYESLNENVATVTADGDITAVADGTATIKAKTTIDGTEYTDTFDVEVGHSFSVDFRNVDRDTQVFPSNVSSDQSFSNASTHGDNWTIDTVNSAAKHYDGTTSSVRIQSNYAYIKDHGPFAVNFTVEKGGKYDIDATVYTYSSCGNADFYIDGAYIGTINMIGTTLAPKDAKLLGVQLTEGTHSLAVVPVDGYAFVQKFDFSVVKATSAASISATVESSDMLLEETQNINVAITAPANTVFDNAKAFTTVTNKAVVSNGNAITYTGYDAEIISVSDTGLITALAEGSTEVTVSAILGGVQRSAKVKINVGKEAPGEAAAQNVSLYIKGTTGGTVTADKVAANIVTSADAGTEITAEAIADTGYKFSHWKDSSGNFVSESAEYTFTPYTNTAIIAVFDDISEETKKIGVEFYDGNRDFLGLVETGAGTIFESIEEDAPTPELTGYVFKEWSLAANTVINELLRAVAIYEQDGIAVTGITVNDGEVSNVKYGDEITRTIDGAKAWYRDTKLVGYGDTYTYLAWSTTEIESSETEPTEIVPLAVLNVSGEAYMLEYDAAGYEIVDAGILFGDDAHNTVNACYYKSKVKEIKEHGQFTAKKSADKTYPQTVVKGYVMFKDTDGDLRVIYSN